MRLLILLALVSVACGHVLHKRSNRIVGGDEVQIEVHPYMSNLQFHYNDFVWIQLCGGTLLTSRTVMTAAHCLVNLSTSQWRVRLGSSLASSGGHVFESARFILHEDYDPEPTLHDIAILVMRTAATFSDSIAVARIPVQGLILPDNTSLVAIGWGSLWSDGPTAERLQHVYVDLINHRECAARYEERREELEAEGWHFPKTVEESMICTGKLDIGGADACQGDSGGPVALEQPDVDIIYGITSWGAGCADSRFPGVNTRVSYYTDWIVRNGSV